MPEVMAAGTVLGGLWSSILHMPVIAVILLIAGVLLLGAEIFSPGFGLTGALGLACLFGAIVFTAQSFTEGLILTLLLLAAAGIVLAIVLTAASRGKLKIILCESSGTGTDPAAAPYADSLGKTGIAVTVLRPAGAAEIDGKRLDVVTQGEYLEAGTPVEVLRVEGNRIVVRKIGGLQSAGE
ncbi:MAG: NfeD family protein [Eubacteriales bacterium]|nr:NfeD family protein [Eubacteriales bacterium]